MPTGTRTMENITIKHYYGDTLCDGATVARKHRLYVTNRWMFQEYKKAMSAINPTKNKDKLVSIAYLAGVPVACSLTDTRPLTQLFVRKALRRQGATWCCSVFSWLPGKSGLILNFVAQELCKSFDVYVDYNDSDDVDYVKFQGEP